MLASEQAVVLEYERHLLHQHMGIDLAHIHAAHLHRAGVRIPELGIRLAAVVLPPPEGPTSATVSPTRRVKETWDRAGTARRRK